MALIVIFAIGHTPSGSQSLLVLSFPFLVIVALVTFILGSIVIRRILSSYSDVEKTHSPRFFQLLNTSIILIGTLPQLLSVIFGIVWDAYIARKSRGVNAFFWIAYFGLACLYFIIFFLLLGGIGRPMYRSLRIRYEVNIFTALIIPPAIFFGLLWHRLLFWYWI